MSTKNLRLLAFALLLICALTGGWMAWRTSQQLLWGYAPLLLYGTGFLGYFLLRNHPRGRTASPDRWLILLGGLLLGLGFAGTFGILLFLFVGFVPLFMYIIRARTRDAKWTEVFRQGFAAFVLFNVLTTYWVTNTGFFAGFFAMLANSVLMCLPWMALYWASKRTPKMAFLTFSAAWLSFEFLHYHWGLNWPWLTLGNGLADHPEFIQWYEVTGVLGGSAWILGCNYLAFKLFSASTSEPGLADVSPAAAPDAKGVSPKFLPFRKPLPYLALLLLPMAGSMVRFYTYAAPVNETITVAAIQPNFEPHYEKFSDPQQTAPLDTFLRLSKAALQVGPVDYLLYPETSFSSIEERNPLDNNVMRTLNTELSGSGADYLVTGYSGYYRFGTGETLTPAVRYAGDIAYEGLNAALQLRLGTADYQTYRKGVFVPGAESFPFRQYLPFMEPLVASVGGSVAGLGTQARRTPFVSPKAKVAPVICYESVFGEYFTDYIREGAQAVFVMTNDGWWDHTAGHQQHLWYSSIRAIETRRAVVRSANVGACAFIDQRGDIISRTRYDQAGYLRGELLLNDEKTLYVRFGDVIAKLALLLMVVLLTLAAFRPTAPPAASRY